MDNIGIKIKSNDKIAKCIGIIRKYTNISIGEMKAKIINNEYVMVCGYTDEDGIKSIVEAYKEVTILGVDAVIYEHDRVTTVDFLINLMDMHGDIERDMQEMKALGGNYEI